MKLLLIAILVLALLPCAAMAEMLSVPAQDLCRAMEGQLLGQQFGDMDPDQLAAYAAPQRDRYAFLGRASQDGATRYLLGQLRQGAQPPAMKEGFVQTDQGLWIASPKGQYLLFLPGEESSFVMHPVAELFTLATRSGGFEALEDATRRGVSRVPVPPPFAAVTMHRGSERVTEYIPLTQAQIAQFQKGKKLKNPGGNDYTLGYSLAPVDEYSLVDFVKGGVPQSLLALAIDRCGYEPPFTLPKAAPVQAAFTVYREGQLQSEQTLEDPKSLKKLAALLRSMKRDAEGKCGYYGKLVLTYKSGAQCVFYKGMDNCGSIMMGSGASRSLSRKGDKAFWALFPRQA